MSDAKAPSNKGWKVLVVHSPIKTPDEALVRKLLRDAGCKVIELVFATPADVAAGKIDPSTFDKVIALLDDDLGQDSDLDASVTAIAQGGQGIVGIWAPGTTSSQAHRAIQLYGTAQCPWDPSAVAKALEDERPQAFQSSSGGATPSHDVRPNRC